MFCCNFGLWGMIDSSATDAGVNESVRPGALQRLDFLPRSSQGPSSPPTPPEIANRSNFSESGLVTFLLNPHAKMPNMSLTRIEANDIAAYIRTLR
jgi:mono/diheme cytochrome c family protein